MLSDLLTLVVAAAGAALSLFGETWNEKEKRLTGKGGGAVLLIVVGFGLAAIQSVESNLKAREVQFGEDRLSHRALISFYGPLSMLFDDFPVSGANVDSREKVYPPFLNLDMYQAMSCSDAPRSGRRQCLRNRVDSFADYLTTPVVTPNGTERYDVALAFVQRYGRVTRELNKTTNYFGNEIDTEAYFHLVDLLDHSFFRDAEAYRGRGDLKPCTGWVDQIILEITTGDLDTAMKARCQTILRNRLTLMFQDPWPEPPFANRFAKHHNSYCETVGYRRPFCSWAQVRSSSGVPLE